MRPVPGQEAFIVVNSSDASGNGSRFRLPVRVMPVGIEVEKLFQNRQRR